MKGKNGIVDFSRARVSRKKVSPGRYGGNIAIFFFGLSAQFQLSVWKNGSKNDFPKKILEIIG